MTTNQQVLKKESGVLFRRIVDSVGNYLGFIKDTDPPNQSSVLVTLAASLHPKSKWADRLGGEKQAPDFGLGTVKAWLVKSGDMTKPPGEIHNLRGVPHSKTRAVIKWIENTLEATPKDPAWDEHFKQLIEQFEKVQKLKSTKAINEIPEDLRELHQKVEKLALSGAHDPIFGLADEPLKPRKRTIETADVLPRTQWLVDRPTLERDIYKAMTPKGPGSLVLEGTPGTGKTSLAVAVARMLRANGIFESIVFVTMVAEDRRFSLNVLLDEIAETLGYPATAYLESTAAKLTETLRLLAKFRCLVILDNFEDLEPSASKTVLQFLDQIPQNSGVLITSRPNRNTLYHAHFEVKPIRGLEKGEAKMLFHHELDSLAGADAEELDEIFESIFDVTSGNPFAIRRVIGHLKERGFTIEKELQAILGGRHDIFQYLYEQDWMRLDSASKDLLVLASIFAEQFPKKLFMLASPYDSEDHFEAVADPLFAVMLIESNGGFTNHTSQLYVHPLTRAYVRSTDRGTELATYSHERVANALTSIIDGHAVSFWEHRNQSSDDLAELERLRTHVSTTVEYLRTKDSFENVAELIASYADFLVVRGHWSLCLDFGKTGIHAAQQCDRPDLELRLRTRSLGHLLTNQHSYDEAIEVMSVALELCKVVDDSRFTSEAFRVLGRCYRKAGKIEQASKNLKDALKEAKKANDRRLEALALNEQGKLLRDTNNPQDALTTFDQAKRLVEDLDSSIHAGILCNISGVELSLGLLERARKNSENSLAFFEPLNNLEGIATNLLRLAEISKLEGKDTAYDYAADALEIFERLGMEKEMRRLDAIIGDYS